MTDQSSKPGVFPPRRNILSPEAPWAKVVEPWETKEFAQSTAYISVAEHQALLAETRAAVWREASIATHKHPHYSEFRRYCLSMAMRAAPKGGV